MKPVPQKNIERRRAAVVKNSSQRKKLVFAAALLAIMGILWLRVFTGKGKPQSASAVLSANTLSAASNAADSNVIFIDLPVVSGRHNVLANDFFDAKLFREFGSGDLGIAGEVIESKENSHDITAAAAAVDAMELIAIVNGKKPQAFIEDKLLEEGQTFRFMFHDQNYEFKVVKIHNNKVELECNGGIITKRIPESSPRSEQ